MLGVKCRLCSADCELISLMNGKCRKNRDYIRKMVEITIGIKFEKNDDFKFICYPCTVQVYNFYIFKTRSVENEKFLKISNNEHEKSPNKMKILDLHDIAIPDVEELKEILVPWLLSKQNQREMLNNDYNKVIDTESHSNAYTQYDEIESCDISTQCSLANDSVHKATQIQLTIAHSNKSTQCAVNSMPMQTQTNGILTKSCKIQCCLMGNIEIVRNKNIRDSYTQMELVTVDKSVQHCSECKENFTVTDCKCQATSLVKMKKELDVNCISAGLNVKNSAPPLAIALPSPPLLSIQNRTENVIICRNCDQALYSKEEYQLHKKRHMICKFCKKKFTSIVRTKWHVENDCKIRNSMKSELVVQLVRFERLKNMQKTYDKCLDSLNEFEREERLPRMRIRSRSISSMDSYFGTCTVCECSFTVLHDVKVGVDKCVQTFNDQMVQDFVAWGHVGKGGDVVVPPPKKMKLSPCIA